MKKFLIYLGIAFLVPSMVSAQSITKEQAEQWATQKGVEIVNIVASTDENKYEKLDSIILNDVDIRYIAKFVVGKYWRTMTAEQQDRYLHLFENYLLSIYKTFPLEFKSSEIEFQISDVKLSEKYADIIMPISIQGITTTSNGDDTIYITFRIHKNADKLQLVDLKIAESSLLMSYRNKIYELMEKDEEEIEWFLEDFESWIPNTEEK